MNTLKEDYELIVECLTEEIFLLTNYDPETKPEQTRLLTLNRRPDK